MDLVKKSRFKYESRPVKTSLSFYGFNVYFLQYDVTRRAYCFLYHRSQTGGMMINLRYALVKAYAFIAYCSHITNHTQDV